jgi:SWI/SNF-related matrix-associated actin-dependent regulator of chromatin subfamily A-like protein 1
MIKLLPFQKEDVESVIDTWNRHSHIRSLFSHEMGLGKCIMSSYIIKTIQQLRPILIICPAFLKLQWQEELKRFNIKSRILNGQFPSTKELKFPVLIINYDILGYWFEKLRKIGFQLVVGDEVQYISGFRSQRSRAMKKLCKKVPHLLFLSGTPLSNKPWELFPAINILWPKEFPSSFAFGWEYCQGEKQFGHWKFSGAKNLIGLHKRLLRLGMIRRTKEEVLKELPKLRKSVVLLDLDDRSQYEHAEEDLIGWLRSVDPVKAERAARNERMVKFGYLLRLAARLKMNRVFDWVDSWLENSDGKLLIGAWHRKAEPIIPKLMERYGKLAVTIHGGISMKERQEAERKYQSDKDIRICVGQIKACGVGLNLTATTDEALIELGWTPGAIQQFIARGHRIGTLKPVSVYFLIAQGTIEQKLCKLLQKKEKILNQVLDGVVDRVSSMNIYNALHKEMMK